MKDDWAREPNEKAVKMLIVLTALPWPPRQSGVGMRFAPLIEYLAPLHQLDVLIVPTYDPPLEAIRNLIPGCRVDVYRPDGLRLPPLLRKIRTIALSLLPWTVPYGSIVDRSPRRLEKELSSRVSAGRYDIVAIGGHLLDVSKRMRRIAPDSRLIVDMVDSPTLTTSRHYGKSGPASLFGRYTAWKCARLERRIRRTFDASIYISEVDAATIPHERGVPVHVIPNGVLSADVPKSFNTTSTTGKRIGFLGNMSYEPNVLAATRLVNSILPLVSERDPDASALIIGRDPTDQILALESGRVHVTGTVPDIWPHVESTTLFAFPMISGAGLQNKILDAMLGGIPVVTSSLAATSLGATDGKELLVAETDQEFAECILRLLGESGLRSRLAENAKQLLATRFSWPTLCRQYELLLLGKK